MRSCDISITSTSIFTVEERLRGLAEKVQAFSRNSNHSEASKSTTESLLKIILAQAAVLGGGDAAESILI
jgi:hypothetical protein